MKPYIYVELKEYKKDLRKYNAQKDQFERLIETLKNSNSTKDLESYLNVSSENLFKKRTGDYRLIIQKIEIEGSIVYCTRKIFLRSNKSYKKFYKPNPEEWLRENPISEEEYLQIKDWVLKIKKEEELSSKPKKLPDELYDWLDINSFETRNTIYEIHEWTESIKDKKLENYISSDIPKLITNIYDSSTEVTIKDINDRIKQAEKGNICILFEKYGDILILYDVFLKEEKKINDIHKKIKNIHFDLADLKNHAKKAYPEYILCDIDSWTRIQKDIKGNLSLSPEQEKILKEPKFPLFINGQAGSGKSTMLFYLFAHLLFQKRENKIKPIFLTYNEILLKVARDTVKSILLNNPIFSEYFKEIGKDKIDDKLQEIFYPFQKYILNFLPSEQQKKFTLEKYISFNKFKNYYNGTTKEYDKNCKLNKRYSAELVWHIIRTYIKGTKIEDFSEEDFKNLQRRDKSVDFEVFEEINKTIWESWYKKFFEEYGLWDDQDLVKFILKNTHNFPERSAVFCDEVQDFTRNEIELILRLSSFTKYDLTEYLISSSNSCPIPLVFAGDPHQTINPTGFRWELVKGIFLEKFKELTNNAIEINFEVLSQNYRSQPLLVKFANTIQIIRAKYLKTTDIKPQSPYQKSKGEQPYLFILEENISIKELEEVIQKNIISIVPSDSGISGETEFVKEDNLLKKLITTNEIDKPIPNILSSASSKGLEFEKVIIYKFGYHCPSSFNKLLNGDSLIDSEIIELSYFFNKLYVAISRAKDYLFIIDNKTGYENFWKKIDNINLEELIQEKRNDDCWKNENLSKWKLGRKEGIELMKEVDYYKIAKSFEESGMINKNSENLERAAYYYKLDNHEKDSQKCQAFAYKYSEKYLEAGDIFIEIKNNFKKLEEKGFEPEEEAIDCYWKGAHWDRINGICTNKHYGKKTISAYMLNEVTIEYILDTHIQKELIKELKNDTTTKKILLKIKKDIEQSSLDNYTRATFLKEIAKKGLKKSNEFFNMSAHLYFQGKYYIESIELWEKINHIEHINYYKAKLEKSYEIDEKIHWMDKLNMYEEIIKEYHKSTSQFKKQESHEIMFSALIVIDKFVQALNYEYIPVKNRIEKLIRNTKNNIDNQISMLAYLFKDLNNYNECWKIIHENIHYFEDSIKSQDFFKEILKSENYKIITRDFIKIITEYTAVSTMVKIIFEQTEENNIVSKVEFMLDTIKTVKYANKNKKEEDVWLILNFLHEYKKKNKHIKYTIRKIEDTINNIYIKNIIEHEDKNTKIELIKKIKPIILNLTSNNYITKFLEYIIDNDLYINNYKEEKQEWIKYKKFELKKLFNSKPNKEQINEKIEDIKSTLKKWEENNDVTIERIKEFKQLILKLYELDLEYIDIIIKFLEYIINNTSNCTEEKQEWIKYKKLELENKLEKLLYHYFTLVH